MQLIVSASQNVKDAEVVKTDPMLVDLRAKKADEVSAWVDSKTNTSADIQKLLKSLSLAVNHLLRS